MKIVAIQNWQEYLWRRAPFNATAENAIKVDGKIEHFSSRYHPWGNSQNVLQMDDEAIASLRSQGIICAVYED